MNIFSAITGAGVFLGLIVLIVFFLVIRKLVTWYWKIDRINELLEKIEENTRKIEDSKNLSPK